MNSVSSEIKLIFILSFMNSDMIDFATFVIIGALLFFFYFILKIMISNYYTKKFMPSVDQILSPRIATSQIPNFKLLMSRLRMLLVNALKAESKSKMDEACSSYYFALIIDLELGKPYHQNLWTRLQTAIDSPAFQKILFSKDPYLEKQLSMYLKSIKEAEDANDLPKIIRFSEACAINYHKMHRYPDAILALEKVMELKMKLHSQELK